MPGTSATSGQCGHPARQALFGLVMVRAQELACRRGMNESDWEAVAEPAAFEAAEPVTNLAPVVLPVEREPVVEQPGAAEPAPTVAAVKREDALPAEAPRRPVRREAPEADPARRRGFQGMPPPVVTDAPVTPRRELNTDGIPIVRQRSGVVAEAHRKAQRRQRLAEARRVEQSARQREVSANPPPADAPPPEDDHMAGHGQAAPERASGAEMVVETTPEREVTVVHVERTAPAPASHRLPARTIDAHRETPDDVEALDAAGATVDPERAPAVAPARDQLLPVAPQASDELTSLEDEWLDQRRAEHGQKCCGTCRDFRATDTPGRGWCANAFAQSHRQLVGTNDLACLSVLGVWWVASDEVWLSQAGPAHTGPTPLADELYDYLTRRRRRPRA